MRKPRYRKSKPTHTDGNPTVFPLPLSNRYLNPSLTLTPDVISLAVSSIQKGISIHDSFLVLGIPKATFSSWFKKANDEIHNRELGKYNTANDIYLDLFYQVQQATVQFEHNLLSRITQNQDWKSAAWLLERINRERYQLTNKVESVATTDTVDHSKVEIVITDQTDDERIARIEREIGSNL